MKFYLPPRFFGLSIFLSSLLLSSFVQAQLQPTFGKDQRVQYFNYADGEVYPIYSKIGYSSLIQLEKGENLKDDGVLGMGFAKGWSLGVKENNIVFKPIGESPDTNMLIVTNKRTYAFDLKVRNDNITYIAKFKYPDTEQKEKDRIADKKPSQLFIREVKDESGEKVFIDNRINLTYFKKGNLEISPTYVWDDGLFTYLKYENASDLPTVYKLMPDGSEVLTNSHTMNDVLVIHEVAKTLRLRLGKSVVDIYNGNFKQSPFNKNGTSQDDTFRTESN